MYCGRPDIFSISVFNILVGLCVGHGSLFFKHSKALATVLIAKDRVPGHNPAAAHYTVGIYYSRLLRPGFECTDTRTKGGRIRPAYAKMRSSPAASNKQSKILLKRPELSLLKRKYPVTPPRTTTGR